MAENARIDDLRKRLEKEPGSRLFAQLAEELRKAGELAEAIGVCRAGLEKQPAFWSARMTLGRALQDTGDLAGAIAEFEAVLKAAPDNILASRLLGESLEGTGNLAGAVARYKTTLALAPGDAQVVARLAQIEARLKAPAVAAPLAPAASAPGFPPPAAPEPEAATLRARGFANDAPIPLVDAEESFELESPYMDPARGAQPIVTAAPFAQAPAAPAPLPVADPDNFEFETAPGATIAVASTATELKPPVPSAPPVLHEPVATPEPAAGQEPEAVLPPAFDSQPAPEPEPEPEPEAAPELTSSTLAELYFNQGHTSRAIDVYRQLLDREPGNERARARLTELTALESHLNAEELRGTVPQPADPRAARRAAIERTIARLEALLAAVRRE